MNKSDLINHVHSDMGGTKVAAEFAVNSVIEHLKAGIRSDGVQLVGFGSFSKGVRSARKGRNPATGAEIDIPASTTVKFHAGKELKASVNP